MPSQEKHSFKLIGIEWVNLEKGNFQHLLEFIPRCGTCEGEWQAAPRLWTRHFSMLCYVMLACNASLYIAHEWTKNPLCLSHQFGRKCPNVRKVEFFKHQIICYLNHPSQFHQRSPRQMPTTKFPRSPTSTTRGFSLTRLSPRQCTAERLRICQGDCLPWPEDPSANYAKQCLFRCTMQ